MSRSYFKSLDASLDGTAIPVAPVNEIAGAKAAADDCYGGASPE
jgi:hypothetical protein